MIYFSSGLATSLSDKKPNFTDFVGGVFFLVKKSSAKTIYLLYV